MAIPPVFPDATTRNRPYSIFWQPKRPLKWPFRRFSRTLRHEIGPTAYSGSPSVHENGPHRCFPGRYDTESRLQRVLAVQASLEMALPSVFPDTTTRNRPYSIFWQPKRPRKWPTPPFSRTLRHEIGPTAYSGCPSVKNRILILCEQKLEGCSSKTIDARVVVNGRGPRRRRGRDRAFRPVVLELYPSSFS